MITQWRHSAEVYADPVLLESLTGDPEGDLGPVPPPQGEERARGGASARTPADGRGV